MLYKQWLIFEKELQFISTEFNVIIFSISNLVMSNNIEYYCRSKVCET